MKSSTVRTCVGAMAFGGLVALAVGCGQSTETGSQAKGETDKDAKIVKKEHDHSGWWCDEHGIPEHECSMCSASYARECKANGDWCDKHDRARSQCFICEPALKERFAAKHRAKYGTEPPPIGEDLDVKPDDKKFDEKK